MIPDIVLCGVGSAGGPLLRALRDADLAVTVYEADRDIAQRVGDLLGKEVGPDQFRLTTAHRDIMAPIFISNSDMVHLAPEGALVVMLDTPAALVQTPAPDRTVAVDMMNPGLVEVAYGIAEEGMRARTDQLLKRIGATVVISTGHNAFAGTTLMDSAYELADGLLLSATTPWELDDALEKAGFAEGLLAAQDEIGLDVAFVRRQATGAQLLISDRMVREGRLGRSVGVGWYRYPGGGGAVIDPLLEDMIVEEARFAGICRAEITEEEVSDALILGVAHTAADLHAAGLPWAQIDLLSAYRLRFNGLSHIAQERVVATKRAAQNMVQLK